LLELIEEERNVFDFLKRQFIASQNIGANRVILLKI